MIIISSSMITPQNVMQNYKSNDRKGVGIDVRIGLSTLQFLYKDRRGPNRRILRDETSATLTTTIPHLATLWTRIISLPRVNHGVPLESRGVHKFLVAVFARKRLVASVQRQMLVQVSKLSKLPMTMTAGERQTILMEDGMHLNGRHHEL